MFSYFFIVGTIKLKSSPSMVEKFKGLFDLPFHHNFPNTHLIINFRLLNYNMKIIKNKIVLLGDSYVGKSSIAIRFSKDEFSVNTESTLGAVFFTHQIIEEDKKI